jgi:hypothetical protein
VISCDAGSIVEQSHVTSASERNSGATAQLNPIFQPVGENTLVEFHAGCVPFVS